MESHAQSADNVLLDGFSFKLPATADYVTNRRSVTFMPQGGNDYSTTGVKVIKINLTGQDWLDVSTVRLSFTINNLGTGMLRTLGGPWSFFRRLRVLCGGTVIEDIDGYSRVHEMFHILTNPVNRQNDVVESGCSQQYDIIRNATYTDDGPQLNKLNFLGINPSDSRTVFFKPLAGILNQDKFLPIRYCPLVFEFELITYDTDVVVYPALLTNTANSVRTSYADKSAPTGYIYPTMGLQDLNFAQDNCSKTWKLTNVQLKCDLITLDNGLENEYSQHLLSGKSLPINYSTFITQKQIVNGADYATSITRSLSRLKSVFLTFGGTGLGDATQTTLPAPGMEMRKWWNDFYHPSYKNDPTYTNNKILLGDDEVEIQMQLGSKYFPEYPLKSVAEAFYQLRKTLGIAGSSWHGIDIRPDDYRNCKYIVGIDTEKMLDAGFTGTSTKAGDLMTIRVKQPKVATANQINCIYITLHSDQVLEIRDSGTQVMD